MKTIIAGSRTITDYASFMYAMDNFHIPITEVISGEAMRIDKLGEYYASRHNIPVKRFPAEWIKYGKKAGYIRNEEMAKYADACIVIWNGNSKGSANMIQLATKYKLKLYVYTFLN